jgi:cell pole-organizing protein PopZ
MAEASKDSDQSMEDILQSIKRIIADEGDPVPAMPGSDVLELTELLAEDVAVSTPPPAPPAPPPAKSAQDDIDALFNSAPVVEPEPVVEAPVPAAAPTPTPTPTPVPAPIVEVQRMVEPVVEAPGDEPLMSSDTLSASLAALQALSHKPYAPSPSPAFRSGTTVEDLVMEALKPMLKDWLDNNLPALVRSLVEREVRRLSGGH